MFLSRRLNGPTLVLMASLSFTLLLLMTEKALCSVALTWTAPTTNTDGSPLTDLAGYKIYYGTAPGNYSASLNVGNTTSASLTLPQCGVTNYFAATAYDIAGIESTYSNEVAKSDPCTAPTCVYTYSNWGACRPDGTQTRTILSALPGGCTGTPLPLTQSCTYIPPTCLSFTYSAWGACQPNNTQTRTVLTSSPSGCTGGSPVTSQTCTFAQTYTITATAGSGGNINPSGVATVSGGATQTYKITPAKSFTIAGVTVDGVSVGAVSSYTFSNMIANHTISATFTKKRR
ncbi:MAG TPA: hypothetical protein VK448_08505 [Dissulfurispiraceae bacterium]|nr:hypothetical protein [Dissulfurispiraceae bacterium]